MLEKPNVQDETIVACLQDEYRLLAGQIAFLPIGADQNTAVYRLVANDGSLYFVKLRRGAFDEIAVTLPKYLSEQGIAQIIAPLPTKTGQLWAKLEGFKAILYPFVEGHDGYEVDISDRQWVDLGIALKHIHTMDLPPALKRGIPQESYSPRWREMVKAFLGRVEDRGANDPIAADLSSFLKAKRSEIETLADRAERHARTLRSRPGEFVLCHSDIHAGNILIGVDNALYIVDWDNPILALKERDLMFIGGAQGFRGHTLEEEEILFYRGYGQAEIDRIAMAYYRYERIVEDIAAYCEQILLSDEGNQDRAQSLYYLKSNFLPNGTIEIAHCTI